MAKDTGKALLERLAVLEADVHYREPAQPGEEDFRYIPGSKPVLVSAPHGAAHYRNGRLKEEDEYTGAIVQYLSDTTGSHGLYLRRQSPNDSNYDHETQYKRFLRSTIREQGIQFVLDLHGSSDRHDFGMALGTMNGRSCPEQISTILEVLKEHGFHPDGNGYNRLDIDGRFTASGGYRQETITRFVKDSLGVNAVQVELASRIRVVQVTLDGKHQRIYQGDPDMIEKTISALAELVRRL
jgi:hypothetical protein